MVASVLSCDFSLLPASQFKWKFEGQPQSARKKIANEAGFGVLIDGVKAKRVTDHIVVQLYTPKPFARNGSVCNFCRIYASTLLT